MMKIFIKHLKEKKMPVVVMLSEKKSIYKLQIYNIYRKKILKISKYLYSVFSEVSTEDICDFTLSKNTAVHLKEKRNA